MKKYIVVALFCIALFLTGCPQQTAELPTCVETNCNCSDFATQEEAQRVLDAFPGDRFRLDGDGNGIACESLPSSNGRQIAKTPIPTSSNVNLKFGNPSRAGADLNNYLMEKPQFTLSYNCSRGIPNWVSWQLNSSWLGSADRANDFRPDPDLPANCYQVRATDYRGTGYDRGHLTPSGDRTRSAQDNSATFLMTNMIPQAPANNREVWNELEQYSRELVRQGKELYIVAGGEGNLQAIAAAKVIAPAYTWKVILVVDRPGAAPTENSRTIAVRMPNTDAVARTDWRDYRVSVDSIEKLTGYDFFSNVPPAIQSRIESRVDEI
ncbi:DNA/RNA non-specific endonuclease [Oscillatoria laete-virens NRMC-F 0139]|nr:DNA/RNA non-specific endonuclease [Oscillatoria laete-virens]MDL5055408.1 DNA/RNA non-specific endonuclease [Oscillatoria laete-virens NRMC-F 0139]